MKALSIDIETFSDVDLNKCGIYPYVESPNFDVILLAYKWEGETVQIVDLAQGEEIPEDVAEAIIEGKAILRAWNAAFERTCLAVYFGLPSLSPEPWYCTMVKAAMLGLPMALGNCANVLKLEQRKDLEGKALIKYFCMPCKPCHANGFRTRNLPEHDPERWEKFKSYCGQDVVVEDAIGDKLAFYSIPADEKELWNLDQKINDTGIEIDQQFIHNAIKIDKAHRERLITEAISLTGITNPNSADQLKKWLALEMPMELIAKLRKEDIPVLREAAANYIKEDVIKRVLTIRQELSKTSIKKYAAMLEYLCADGRVRGLLQFYGAGRTGRWAGRGVQVHNLPRNYLKDLDLARQLVARGDGEGLEMLFGNVPDTLSQLIRTAFVSGKGKHFKVSDFSAIEARVLAWLAGERWRLEVFATHGKIYEASAAKMFSVPIESIDKDNPLRQKGKVAELALGYQGGANALITMGALKQGLTEEELPALVHAWRIENQEIVRYWKIVNEAAIKAVEEPGRIVIIAYSITFQVRRGVLFIKLPSGRELAYLKPTIKKTWVVFVQFNEDINRYKKGQKTMLPLKEAETLSNMPCEEDEFLGIVNINSEPFENKSLRYEGMNQTTKQWTTLDTYGGKLVENIVQAVARDCLAVAMTRADGQDFAIVMDVHDEIVCECDEDDPATLEELNALIAAPISWAKGLPLGAEGFVGDYYRK